METSGLLSLDYLQKIFREKEMDSFLIFIKYKDREEPFCYSQSIGIHHAISKLLEEDVKNG